MSPANDIQALVDRERRASDEQDLDALLSIVHPEWFWPWPPHPQAHDPMAWVLERGCSDETRWRAGWAALFRTHRLVHNYRTARKIALSQEGGGAWAAVDVDTLWRGLTGPISTGWAAPARSRHSRAMNGK